MYQWEVDLYDHEWCVMVCERVRARLLAALRVCRRTPPPHIDTATVALTVTW